MTRMTPNRHKREDFAAMHRRPLWSNDVLDCGPRLRATHATARVHHASAAAAWPLAAHGYEATREAAMAAFAKTWRVSLDFQAVQNGTDIPNWGPPPK